MPLLDFGPSWPEGLSCPVSSSSNRRRRDGAGEGAALRGSAHNDPIADADGRTATNHAGGIAGGITNGNELVVRAAVKPTASIAREQQTFDFAAGRVAPLRIRGRHDACIALRAAVVVEAAMAVALADFKLRDRCRRAAK